MPRTANLEHEVLPAPQALETAPAEPSLLDTLAAIERDSATQSETYLRDTVVPHGGE